MANGIVGFDNLGMCNVCGSLLDKQALASEGGFCHCGEMPTQECFGIVDGEKKLWLGPDGRWGQTSSKKNFFLGNWEIGRDTKVQLAIPPGLS